MKTLLTRKRLLAVAALLLATVQAAGAQNIYKCTQAGRIEYTDRPCPGRTGELIHQADDREIIDQYLRLGQDAVAKRYADAHHLETLYQQRLAAHQQTLEEKARRQADATLAAQQQHDEAARQQALADDAANRERLHTENEALRQQNAQYQDQLAQPIYNPPPAYWSPPPYWNRHRDHHDDNGHDQHPPPKDPVLHPCKQLAGGRVEC